MDLDCEGEILRARTQHFIYTLLGGNQTLGARMAGEPSFYASFDELELCGSEWGSTAVAASGMK